jgi:hypothetical protein
MIVTDEMVEKYRKVQKQSISLLKWKSTILSLLTQTMDQTEHDIEKIFSQTLRNILHWVRAH